MKKIYAILKILYVILFILLAHFICESTPYYLNKVDYGNKIRIVIDSAEETNNIPDEVIIKNDEILLSISTIKKYIDSSIYSTEETVKINHDKYIVTMPLNSNTIKINTDEIILNQGAIVNIDANDSEIYIPIKALEEVYNIKVEYNDKVIITTEKGDTFFKGTLSKNVKLKKYKREKCLTVSKMKKGDKVEILTSNYETLSPKEYIYIRTSNGDLGYVMRKDLKLEKIENRVLLNDVEISRMLPHEVVIIDDDIMLSMESIQKFIDKYIYLDKKYNTVIAISGDMVAKLPVASNNTKINDKETTIYTPVQYIDDVLYIPIEALKTVYNFEISRDKYDVIMIDSENTSDSTKSNLEKISLVWEYAQNYTPNRSSEKKNDAINIVSPTWIYVSDEKGNVTESITSSYVSWARANGYEVWPTIKNDNIGIEKTSLLVTDMKNRENFINNILNICKEYKFEGINLDFEHMYQRDRMEYVILVRELAATLKREGIITSVDVNVPDGSSEWSLCFDSKSISDSCDYIMVMAYDQYGQSSKVAGPVAGLNWIEKNMKKMIERDEIDNQKIVLGIPFYSRQWKVKNGEVISTNSLSMKNAVKQIGSYSKWDEELGQYVVNTKNTDTGVEMITYVENKDSLEEKIKLVDKYNLAGVAAWRRGFETEDVWNSIEKIFK